LSVIYLDHNATTPPSPGVAGAVRRAMEETWANPSSIHRAGQAARRQVELARNEVAALLGAPPREIVFTSGGTEAIDLAVRGVLGAAALRRASAGEPPIVASGRVEHAAVRELLEALEKQGAARVRWAPVDRGGVVDLERLPPLLDGAALAAFQWANNETGVVQPVQEIGALCRERGVVLFCDGVQWVGKEHSDEVAKRRRDEAAPPPAGADPDPRSVTASLRQSVSSSGPALIALSAHKFRGPKGVGALWVRRGVGLAPQIQGSQELGRRGGTENVPGIVGLGVAAREAREWLADPAPRRRLAALRDRFEQEVLAAIPAAVVNGAGAGRIWNTTNIGFPPLEAEALLLMLSERGVCASAGAACSSGSLEPSPVLLAMGVPEPIAHGSLRFSLGRETTEEEVAAAAEVVIDCVRRLGAT
jgi:cysteine desulfurase